VAGYQRFGGPCCPDLPHITTCHYKPEGFDLLLLLLPVEASRTSETLMSTTQMTT